MSLAEMESRAGEQTQTDLPIPEIESDFIRWSKAKWVTVILFVVAAQTAFLFTTKDSQISPRVEYAKQPSVAFADATAFPLAWLEIEDQTLFAGANERGFSGAAWIIKAPWAPPAERSLIKPTFLTWEQFRPSDNSMFSQEIPVFAHRPPLTEPSLVAPPADPLDRNSRLRLEDLPPLLSPPALPVQQATDVVRPTVVEVMIDNDGLVLSSRVVASSGSKRADVDALQIARQARFGTVRKDQATPISTGKLIFDWYAVDAAQTNRVIR